MKLFFKAATALAMAGALAGCGTPVEVTQGGSLDSGRIDAAQTVGPFTTAIEFTPKTNSNMQCVALISRASYDGNGGVTCWVKNAVPQAAAPISASP